MPLIVFVLYQNASTTIKKEIYSCHLVLQFSKNKLNVIFKTTRNELMMYLYTLELILILIIAIFDQK